MMVDLRRCYDCIHLDVINLEPAENAELVYCRLSRCEKEV